MTTLLVLVSAFLHAAWNALLKREQDKDRAMIAAVAIGAVLAIVVAAIRAFGASEVPFPTHASFGWSLVVLVAAVVCYLLCVVARELAIRSGAVARVRDRDVHATPIPYFGGVAMLGGLAIRSRSKKGCWLRANGA